ncbi:WD repeat protein [Delphinella strobiligena]|nr:WD repeat protein [Delphinella strobiligena]
MKLTNPSTVPVYTISGSSTARPLPEWLARKRKRSLKQDSEYANRIELLQDFEFEEASSCVRVSDDGNWVMSTGTYKPQIHTHYLPHLSLSYARHTNTVNETFILLSSDYSKSLHLQTDRFLEFHTPGGLHYSARIPRYGRDLKYNTRNAEALIPAVGVNADGMGEVYRLNLEVGRFMKGYEVDVGGDDFTSAGGGALQGGINVGAVNTAAIAEESHNLMAFGTSIGTVEFWDSRSRSRVGLLQPPRDAFDMDQDSKPEITALEFHRSGLNLATGNFDGIVHVYDLRSPVPLLKKDQGYGYPIQTLKYLTPTARSASAVQSEKIMSADKRIIKIWEKESGDPWTSVEPAVDLNHVEWCKDSGMLLTANEGRQQHSFFIPQLGPAPKWCSFLDNLVEEMAEDAEDASAYSTQQSAGAVYDNFKFLSTQQLRELNLDHLVGTTNLLRPYMHGYFVAQKLYEQAKLISNPEIFEEQRAKSIQEKINKERESRIRGTKKAASVKVNRKLAEKMAAKDEANEARKARRVLRQGGDEPQPGAEPMDQDNEEDEEEEAQEGGEVKPARGIMADPRFGKLFQDEEFEIDEYSHEFALQNPSSIPLDSKIAKKRRLTAVEDEALQKLPNSDSDNSDSDDGEDEDGATARQAPQRQRNKNKDDDSSRDKNRISSTSYKKSGHQSQKPGPKGPQRGQTGPQMLVSSSNGKRQPSQTKQRDRSFGSLAAGLKDRSDNSRTRQGGVVGEKEITFAPARVQKKPYQRRNGDSGDAAGGDEAPDNGRKLSRGKERRSASGNVFRKM